MGFTCRMRRDVPGTLRWWNSKSNNVPLATKPMTLVNAANPFEAASSAQFQKLIGRWQRPDGGYVLAIKSIADNGAIDGGDLRPSEGSAQRSLLPGRRIMFVIGYPN